MRKTLTEQLYKVRSDSKGKSITQEERVKMSDLANVLHMNAGDGECSYANNSTLQKAVILKSQKVLQDTINDYGMENNGFSECFTVADLGCSSGPNAFLFVTNMLEIVQSICQKKDLKAPDEFQVFLNDLPTNDFNTTFKILPSFYSMLKNLRGDISTNCFVCGVPGSFYTRLFPRRSLNFVHASYSIHYFSQVPEKLEKNKRNIYMAKTSPAGVYEAYYDQFKRDFLTFLRLRSEEIVQNGRMVLTFIARSDEDPSSTNFCHLFELLAKSLEEMLSEGLLGEEEITSFNLPLYTPCSSEVKAIIQLQNSFMLDRLATFRVNWDGRGGDDEDEIRAGDGSSKLIARAIRAVLEPLIANHFINYAAFMDKLFQRFEMHLTNHLSRENTKIFNIVISLTRKTN